jgi:hypothetical protein
LLVVTLSTQRSGTKFLGNCFKCGTVVTPFGEVFNPDVSYIGSFFDFMAIRGSKMLRGGNDILLDTYFKSFSDIFNISSIDIMFNQIEIPAVTWNGHGHFSMYGYLKQAGAVIISLERSILSTYLSMKYLEAFGGRAHFFRQPTENMKDGALYIDESDFSKYHKNIVWHRSVLKDSMGDYEFFYNLSYDDLSNTQSIPQALRDLIFSAASINGIDTDTSRIQIYEPHIFASNIDYSKAFLNYESINDKYQGC